MNAVVTHSVFDQFNTDHKTFASHVANDLVLLLQLHQLLDSVLAQLGAVFLSVLLFENVENRFADGAREGIA